MADRSNRVESIDALRGLAMVVMVLDHARHAFTLTGSPDDVSSATPALFLTRWVTHFCAPVFVLLAGVSAHLAQRRGRSKRQVAWFLLSRGFWLIALEATVITFGWLHDVRLMFWQVIAAIGSAMIALAGLVFLQRWLVVSVGLALVAGQDLYAPLAEHFAGTGLGEPLWRLLHGGMQSPRFGLVHAGPLDILPVYPVLPWVGVLVLGYAVGPWFSGLGEQRRQRFLRVGAVLVALFVGLRLFDGFGNAAPFYAQAENGPHWMAFLACQKYPPSLAFLLMTLGPAFLALAWLDRAPSTSMRFLQVFGRVPLFFYVLHIYLLHCGSRVVFWLLRGEPVLLLQAEMSELHRYGLSDVEFAPLPAGFEALTLPWAYVVTVVAVLVLYPLCRWFAGVKRGSSSRWLSYL